MSNVSSCASFSGSSVPSEYVLSVHNDDLDYQEESLADQDEEAEQFQLDDIHMNTVTSFREILNTDDNANNGFVFDLETDPNLTVIPATASGSQGRPQSVLQDSKFWQDPNQNDDSVLNTPEVTLDEDEGKFYANLKTVDPREIHYDNSLPVPNTKVTKIRARVKRGPKRPVFARKSKPKPEVNLDDIQERFRKIKIQAKNSPLSQKKKKKQIRNRDPPKENIVTFCRGLLDDPRTNPSVAKWIEKSKGTWKINDKDITRLWALKQNRKPISFYNFGYNFFWFMTLKIFLKYFLQESFEILLQEKSEEGTAAW